MSYREFRDSREGFSASEENAYNYANEGLDMSDYEHMDYMDDYEFVEWEDNLTDVEADADTLASAGYGTDEDYGQYDDYNEYGEY